MFLGCKVGALDASWQITAASGIAAHFGAVDG